VYEMKSQRAGWKKRRDNLRVEQCDNDVIKTTAVVEGKTHNHHASSQPQILLNTALEHRIFVGNISYKVS